MSLQYVHFNNLFETSKKVGSRRGKPIMLTIAMGEMLIDRYLFYLSKNGGWLFIEVPSKYIKF